MDPTNETVYALNPTASAAWDACSEPTTLYDVTNEMRRVLGNAITEDLAEEAVQRLQERKLVNASVNASQSQPTRREVLSTLGKVALPLVVAMTLTEQRAHAAIARSNAPHTPQPYPVVPGKGNCSIIKKLFGGC
ncbi:MAG TPA: PqqD family protein [Acidobacteriaceae bacterium]